MHNPTDRITHTTAFVTPVVEHWLEREIAQWVHHGGSIRRPIAPWANALTTEIPLAPWLHGVLFCKGATRGSNKSMCVAIYRILPEFTIIVQLVKLFINCHIRESFQTVLVVDALLIWKWTLPVYKKLMEIFWQTDRTRGYWPKCFDKLAEVFQAYPFQGRRASATILTRGFISRMMSVFQGKQTMNSKV